MASEVADIAEDDPPAPIRAPRRRAPAAKTKKAARKPIPNKIQNVLWGRSAGRCQYTGCNKLLIGEQISGARNANKSYIAHIVGDSAKGPRGDAILSPQLAHDPDNLMLVCDEHHRVIDREMVDTHSIEILREMKRRHEDRIRITSGIDETRGTHVIRYAARIGTNESPVAKNSLKFSMIPESYPLDDGWIDLDLATLDLPDHEPDFWCTHLRNLRTGFNEKVRGRLERQEIHRLAVFALAPIPLLFELGRLIPDISTAEVRQLLRDPKGWSWDANASAIDYEVIRPSGGDGSVALKLEISAPIAYEPGRRRRCSRPSACGGHPQAFRRAHRHDVADRLVRLDRRTHSLSGRHHRSVVVYPTEAIQPRLHAGAVFRNWACDHDGLGRRSRGIELAAHRASMERVQQLRPQRTLCLGRLDRLRRALYGLAGFERNLIPSSCSLVRSLELP